MWHSRYSLLDVYQRQQFSDYQNVLPYVIVTDSLNIISFIYN